MEPLSANDPQMIGEFRLHARLGAGGMGQVYLGFSPAGRAVAIKVVHTQFARDPEFLQRFSREVAAAGAVSGMYTAPVVGSGINDSPPWLATAFVPGPPLAAVVAKYGPLPEPAVWKLAAGLAEALHAVHVAGLVHRDLKPANVLIADDGPHVIDFGISRAFQGTALTSAGMVVGTPGYMSPEQAEGTVSGPPSDMFSLGCVLAFTSTGKPPFGEGTAAAILFRVVRSEPDLSTVPARLRPMIEACLKKNPAERPDPGRLIAMIAANGPATAATLGSFWPEEVSRVIAAEQAAQTPAGLMPPVAARPSASFSGTPSSFGNPSFPGPGGNSGASGQTPAERASAGFVSPVPPPGERTPTALATPAPGQAAASPGTGHAPMISDGYYAAAAQGRVAPGPAAPGPAIPPLSPVPQSSAGQQPRSYPGQPQPYGGQPQSYAGQPPYPDYPRPGAAGAGTPPPWGQPGGQATWPAGGAPGRQSASRTPPGAGARLARRSPAPVHLARRLMYAGLVANVAAFSFTVVAINRYTMSSDVAKRHLDVAAQNTANTMVTITAFALFADLIGLAWWVVLAVACRRGRGWARVAAAVLLGIYTIIMLLVLGRTHGDPGARFTTLATWLLGLGATIPLFTAQAREFFQAWRGR